MANAAVRVEVKEEIEKSEDASGVFTRALRPVPRRVHRHIYRHSAGNGAVSAQSSRSRITGASAIDGWAVAMMWGLGSHSAYTSRDLYQARTSPVLLQSL